jgi:hypothetical protein
VIVPQREIGMRAIWFVLVGCGWAPSGCRSRHLLGLLILTLPIGLMMFNRTGGIMTLMRHQASMGPIVTPAIQAASRITKPLPTTREGLFIRGIW